MYGDLVSVIIPTYNRKHTIKRAIDSVRNQTYQNIQVIIVDDGSTDGTLEQIEAWYQDADWLLYVINEQNLGAAGSRNVGVQYAEGNYVAFQDSDDEWLPEKLELQMKMMESAPNVGMVYCCMERRIGEMVYDVWPPQEAPMDVKSGNIFQTLLLGPVISTQTMLCDKQCFLEVGGFDDNRRIMEDYEFSIRMAKHFPILLVDEVLAIQYESKGSVNANLDERIIMQACLIDQYYEDFKTLHILENKLENVYHEAQTYGKVAEYLASLSCLSYEECKSFVQRKIAEHQ